MEWIIGILVVLAWVYGLKFLQSVTRAGWRAASGKGSFGSNFEASFVGMKPMETRLRLDQVQGEQHSFSIYRLEIKGIFPLTDRTNVGVSTSLFDVTEKNPDGSAKLQPILCLLDKFQESDSICYQDLTRIGPVDPDSGFTDWQVVANIIPDTLTGPRSGKRKLSAFLSVFDLEDPPTFQHGFRDGSVLQTYVENFEWNLTDEGYREASEKRQRAEVLTIRVAMSMALADGSLAATEGKLLQRWIAQRLEMLDDDVREVRRELLNSAMKQAFIDGKQRRLDLGQLLEEIKEVADGARRLDAVELCLDIMSADGHAGKEELEAIHRMARTLEVELERFQEMKDKRMPGLSSSIQSKADYYALLSMDHGWSKDQIRSHLNKLYSQWNSRAESLSDPEKRAQAESMLETIAAARKALVD